MKFNSLIEDSGLNEIVWGNSPLDTYRTRKTLLRDSNRILGEAPQVSRVYGEFYIGAQEHHPTYSQTSILEWDLLANSFKTSVKNIRDHRKFNTPRSGNTVFYSAPTAKERRVSTSQRAALIKYFSFFGQQVLDVWGKLQNKHSSIFTQYLWSLKLIYDASRMDFYNYEPSLALALFDKENDKKGLICVMGKKDTRWEVLYDPAHARDLGVASKIGPVLTTYVLLWEQAARKIREHYG